jgi:DNA (cytosine-5)-methyltransferase 1
MLSSLPLFPVTRARPGPDEDAGTTERARKDGRVSEPITMGELFCGPGGVAVGAGEAARELGMPLKHVWANDIDPDTCQTYRTNIERMYGDQVLCKNEDVRGLDMSELPDVKGLAFGFPCNDFSRIGKQKGLNGEFGPLYTYGTKYLAKNKELQADQPEWFFAENVTGLRSSDDGRTLALIIQRLSNAGYDVFPHLYKFEEYGLPQKRHRIILIGIRKDLQKTFRPPSTDEFPTMTAREALDRPFPPGVTHNERTRQSAQVIKRLEAIKEGKNAFNSGLDGDLKLNIAGATFSNIYRRLTADEPSYTVTGSGGGGTHMYHWKDHRALTNRERARLQTFPDDFVFHGTKTSIRKQIGMAVPPEGAKIIFKALFQTLADQEYETTELNMDEYGNLVAPGLTYAQTL